MKRIILGGIGIIISGLYTLLYLIGGSGNDTIVFFKDGVETMDYRNATSSIHYTGNDSIMWAIGLLLVSILLVYYGRKSRKAEAR